MNEQRSNKSTTVVAAKVALGSYLEALLREVPDEAPEPAEAAPVTDVPSPAVFPVPPPASEPDPEPIAEPTSDSAPESAPEAAAVASSARPDWARQPFQALVFRVGGLSLAVPLAKLHGVVPWRGDEITPMPNHSARFLGLLRHHDAHVKVVDTAQIVVPERHRDALPEPQERVEHIILIDEGRWGLACDQIGEVLNLEGDGVRWRTAQGKRPWLAGMVPDHLCALLDSDALARLLVDGDGARD